MGDVMTPIRRAAGPRNRAAFTILELLTVMVIVGIVAAASVGKIHSLMVQQRVSRAATVVQTNIGAAFGLAARNRKPIRVSWNSSNQQLVVTDRAGTTTFSRASLASDPYGLPSGSVTFSRTALEVYPSGLANDTLLITLSANGSTRKVWVSRAGLVKFK